MKCVIASREALQGTGPAHLQRQAGGRHCTGIRLGLSIVKTHGTRNRLSRCECCARHCRPASAICRAAGSVQRRQSIRAYEPPATHWALLDTLGGSAWSYDRKLLTPSDMLSTTAELAQGGNIAVLSQEEVTSEELRTDAKVGL